MKRTLVLFALIVLVGFLPGCARPKPEPKLTPTATFAAVVKETVVVEKEVTRVVEKEVIKEVVITATPAPATPTSTPVSTFTSVPPTATPIPSVPTETVVVRVIGTVTSVATASSGTPVAPVAVDSVPLSAVKLTVGQTVIPNWGYGPWAVGGVKYPKIQPGGQIPTGYSQPVTDFTGRNWVDHGSWNYTLPVGASEVWVTIQGDAPGRVSWTGNQLVLESNAQITANAPKALDDAPMPTAGSSGISMVLFVK